jgi:hypothetical protein
MLDEERQEINRREKRVIGPEAWVCFRALVVNQPIGKVWRETGGRSMYPSKPSSPLRSSASLSLKINLKTRVSPAAHVRQSVSVRVAD